MAEDGLADRQRTIDIIVGARNETAPGLSEAEQRLEQFRQKAKKIREEEVKDASRATGGGLLGGLKNAFGEESRFGLAAKTLAGAGAAAGLTLAGREFNEAVKLAVQLRDAFDQGKISAGEMVDKLAGGVPVLGQFWELGRSVRELITGEEAADSAALRVLEETNRLYKEREKILERSIADHQAIAASLGKIRQEAAMLTLPEGERGRVGAAIGREERVGSALSDVDQRAKRDREERLAVIQRLRGLQLDAPNDKARAGLQQQIDEEKAALKASIEQFERERRAVTTAARTRQFHEEREDTRKRNEERLKEQEAQSHKEAEAAEKAHEDLREAERRAREAAETVNGRVDSRLNDFFGDIEADDDVFNQGRRDRRRERATRPNRFTGTAELDTNRFLTGVAAIARERADLASGSSDPEAREREQDRQDARRRHDEEKQIRARQHAELITAIRGRDGGTGASIFNGG